MARFGQALVMGGVVAIGFSALSPNFLQADRVSDALAKELMEAEVRVAESIGFGRGDITVTPVERFSGLRQTVEVAEGECLAIVGVMAGSLGLERMSIRSLGDGLPHPEIALDETRGQPVAHIQACFLAADKLQLELRHDEDHPGVGRFHWMVMRAPLGSVGELNRGWVPTAPIGAPGTATETP